jgi:hypothetical protein
MCACVGSSVCGREAASVAAVPAVGGGHRV